MTAPLPRAIPAARPHPATLHVLPARRAAALGVVALTLLGACGRDAPTAAPAGTGGAADLAAADSIDPSYIAPIEVVADADGDFVSGTVIARFRPGADAKGVAAAQGAGVRRAMLLQRTFVLDVPRGKEQAVARALAHNPNVEFAEPDRLMAVTPCEVGNCTAPTDPFVGYKWDLHNKGTITNSGGTVLGATGAADADIDWLEAFDFLGANFAGTAKIGILDTGIYPNHVDLAGRVVAAQNFATGYASSFVIDRNSHGTHVAGIAAARANNANGLSGVAYGPNIKLINAKVCELYRFPDNSIATSCPSSSTADAIVWATDQGANVLNMSLGGSPSAATGSAVQQAALQYARSRNVLPFCASGNDNYHGVAFPARFPECIAVGATNWSDARASYSNYGAQVALSAPGGDGNPLGTAYSLILSTDTNSTVNNYTWKAGTSMATPQATGLAALLYATGMTDANAVLARMESTADDLGPAGRDESFGYGRINAYRAVAQVNPNAPPVAALAAAYGATVGDAISFDGSASSDPNGRPIAGYAWSFGDGTTASGATASHAYANVGSYTVTLTVTDESGRTGTRTAVATVAPATTAVTVQSASGQYSDQVTLSASLASNAGTAVGTSATGTMEFFANGASLGTQSVLGTGAVTKVVALTQPAASYTLTARYTSTDPNYATSPTSAAAALAVAAESATLTTASTNVIAKQVAAPGGTAGAFTLAVSVSETQPDLPAGAALAGDVNLAPVRMVLVPVGPGTSFTATSCTGAAAATGYATKTYVCSFGAGVAVNTYAVQVSVAAATGGTYYAGSTEDALTIFDPSLGFTTGGGSFAWPGSGERTTFGLTIKYNKSGSNAQGSLVVVRHMSDGTVYRYKSNALDGLALSPATSSVGYATFSGKGTYLEPGWSDPRGNVAFSAYVQDDNEPGTGTDQIWLQLSGGMSMAGPATDNAQPLTGGNISVPHAGGK